jgi:acylaminoacyl-peptidase
MAKRNIEIKDLLSLKFISDPQISPDGKNVVFSVKSIEGNRYDSHIYVGEIESNHVRQFTHGEIKDNQPRWSSTGDKIAFLRTLDKDPQIWSIPLNGGEARKLTDLVEGSIGLFEWSPGGDRIAFEFRPTHPDWTKKAKEERADSGLSNPPRIITRLDYRREGEGFRDCRQHIWVYSITSGKLDQITGGDYDCREPTWSPDGNSIGFIANISEEPERTPFKESIWEIDPNGGSPHLISNQDGYKWGLSWSPNGKYIAYIGTETRDDPWCTHNDRVWIVPTQGGSPQCLTQSLDRIAENVTLSDVRGSGNQKPLWSQESDILYFVISDLGNTHLYQADLNGNYQQIVAGNIDICGFSLDTSKDRFAILTAEQLKPAEIYIVDNSNHHTDGILEPLSQINLQLLKEVSLAKPEEIRFPSTDGNLIQGWILRPPDFDPIQKYPFVLYIHGGPGAQYGNTFFHEFQVLAANGYVVLYTNPRGSLGREELFARCIQGNWGELDFQDLLCAVDFAENLAFIDNNKMAVMGGSYGGFMTTWMIGNNGRFKCGISERGISNRHSAVGSNDYPPMPDGYWAGNPWDRPEALWQQSPLRFAGEIQTPLLIIHSEGDLRCPISQAEQLFSALRKQGKEVVFLRYPAETNHGLSRNGPPDLRVDRLNRIVGWLNDYLKS